MTTTQIPPTTTNDTTPEEPAPGLYGPRGWTTRTPLWYLLRTFPTRSTSPTAASCPATC